MAVAARSKALRRFFASLVIVLMTMALITRAIAAPVIHLHDAMAPEHMPAALAAPVMSDSAHAAPGETHDHAPADTSDSPMTTHAKACDSSGACCGPLAPSDAALAVTSPVPALEPTPHLMSPGVEPASPHRPPSPRLA